MRYAPDVKERALCALEQRGLDASHRRMVDWVGVNKYVLDIGCATGYIDQELNANGCTIVGVEIDPEAAEKARSCCASVLCGDIEGLLREHKITDSFDVILMADVIEHLVDPWTTLKTLKQNLKKNGHLLITIPNVAFFKNRISLLLGHWDYTETGLLDRTHLRFFTFHSFQDLMRESGYSVKKFYINDGRIPGGRWIRKLPLIGDLFNRLNNFGVHKYPNLFGFHFLFELQMDTTADGY